MSSQLSVKAQKNLNIPNKHLPPTTTCFSGRKRQRPVVNLNILPVKSTIILTSQSHLLRADVGTMFSASI